MHKCINAMDGCYCEEEYYQKNGYEIINFEDLNFTNMSKIIGYKAPFQINSAVPKDTIYVARQGYGFYCPQGREGQGSNWYLPKEIVEKWEAVYDKSIEIKGYKAEVNNGRIKFGCQEFTRDELSLLHRLLTSGDLNGTLEIDKVKITYKMIESLIKMLN